MVKKWDFEAVEGCLRRRLVGEKGRKTIEALNSCDLARDGCVRVDELRSILDEQRLDMTAAQWKDLDPPIYTEDEIKVATYASYALYAIGGLLTLLFLFMRKRIQLAMGCVKEASKVGRAFVESATI